LTSASNQNTVLRGLFAKVKRQTRQHNKNT